MIETGVIMFVPTEDPLFSGFTTVAITSLLFGTYCTYRGLQSYTQWVTCMLFTVYTACYTRYIYSTGNIKRRYTTEL